MAFIWSMEWTGNVRKLEVHAQETSTTRMDVKYLWKGTRLQEPTIPWDLNAALGRKLRLDFTGAIHCTVTGKRIRKAYGDGMSFDAWRSAPEAVESVLRPELSRIHEGIALRDEAWEREHHLAPHLTYLSYTGGIKVGVTRSVQALTRWMDQGATAAIRVLDVPYRQLAGSAEVALKSVFSDRTQVAAMLRHTDPDPPALLAEKERALHVLGEDFEPFIADNDEVVQFVYPAVDWPLSIKTASLDRVPSIEGTLVAVKGQYLVWDTGVALNIRSHAGYEVVVQVE